MATLTWAIAVMSFMKKRYEIFRRASEEGAKGVLFDIVGTTCYSLGVEEEEKAYHGEFR